MRDHSGVDPRPDDDVLKSKPGKGDMLGDPDIDDVKDERRSSKSSICAGDAVDIG